MEKRLEDIKTHLMQLLLEREKEFRVDFVKIDNSDFRRRVEAAFKALLRQQRIELSRHETDLILGDLISYFVGLGPIEGLLKDPEVSEVMVNGARQVFIERNGSIERTPLFFRDDEQLMYFIEKVLSPMGRRVSELEPFVDSRLRDGSRVNIVRPPVSTIGPIVTIRKFAYREFHVQDLVNCGALTPEAADFLVACVRARLNILFSGGAGSGKTTLLNALIEAIPENERIISIEDTCELHFHNKHALPLETRPANIEGKGEIMIRHLLRNALHMRPDRILVGEVRGGEALDMIQAMNTGHEGSMTTLHANSTIDALDRLEVLVLMGSDNFSSEVARRQIISAVDLVVQLTRFAGGKRHVTQISEVKKGKEYVLQDIFLFSEGTEGTGQLKKTGAVPLQSQRLLKKAQYTWPGA